MHARALRRGEASEFKALWLEGLRNYPDAFLLTEAEASAVTLKQIEIAISAGVHWGVEKNGALVAIASMRIGGVSRLRHTADIGPFFVSAAAQGQGVAKRMLSGMLEHARSSGLKQVELCVDVQNSAAISLYRAFGFEVFGTRPRSVIIDGIARSDHLMICMLDKDHT